MLRSNYKLRSLSLALTFLFGLIWPLRGLTQKGEGTNVGESFTCGGKRAKTRSAYRRYGFSCPRPAALNPKTVPSLPLSSLRGVSVCARIQDRSSPRRRSRKCRFLYFWHALRLQELTPSGCGKIVLDLFSGTGSSRSWLGWDLGAVLSGKIKESVSHARCECDESGRQHREVRRYKAKGWRSLCQYSGCQGSCGRCTHEPGSARYGQDVVYCKWRCHYHQWWRHHPQQGRPLSLPSSNNYPPYFVFLFTRCPDLVSLCHNVGLSLRPFHNGCHQMDLFLCLFRFVKVFARLFVWIWKAGLGFPLEEVLTFLFGLLSCMLHSLCPFDFTWVPG